MTDESPDSDGKERVIGAVLDAMPQRRSLEKEISRLVRTVGFRGAFAGVGDAAAAALMVSMAVWLTSAALSAWHPQGIKAGNVFIQTAFLAPVLYSSLLALTSWKERMTGTWQVISVCRYGLGHITAVRVMAVSVAGTVFALAFPLFFIGSAVGFRLMALSMLSLFAYAVLTLTALLKTESFTFRFFIPALWAAGWAMALALITPAACERLLEGVPGPVLASTAACAGAFYLTSLRRLILRSTKRMSAY